MDRGSHACPQNYVSVLMLTVKKISLIRVSFCQILLYTLYSVKKKKWARYPQYSIEQCRMFWFCYFLYPPQRIFLSIHIFMYFLFLKCTMAPSGIVWNISYKYFF